MNAMQWTCLFCGTVRFPSAVTFAFQSSCGNAKKKKKNQSFCIYHKQDDPPTRSQPERHSHKRHMLALPIPVFLMSQEEWKAPRSQFSGNFLKYPIGTRHVEVNLPTQQNFTSLGVISTGTTAPDETIWTVWEREYNVGSPLIWLHSCSPGQILYSKHLTSVCKCMSREKSRMGSAALHQRLVYSPGSMAGSRANTSSSRFRT